MRESLIGLRHFLWMKDGRLPNIVLFSQPSRAEQKDGCLRLGCADVIKKI